MASKAFHPVLAAFFCSVCIYDLFFDFRKLETPCSSCNTSHSFYNLFLCCQVIFLLVFDGIYSIRFRSAFELISRMTKDGFESSPSKRPLLITLIFATLLAAFKIFMDSRYDAHFPRVSQCTNHISFLYAFWFASRFVCALGGLRGIYVCLTEEVTACKSGHDLRRCLTLAMEARRIQEFVNDIFGKQICLMHFILLCGFVLNTYLLGYLNLEGWSSTWLNVSFLLNGIECCALTLALAVAGRSVSNAAKALYVSIVRYPMDFDGRKSFSQARYIVLYNLNDPADIMLWTFYPLNLGTYFFITSTGLAFVFVLLQFNSLDSKFDMPIV